MPDKTLNCCDCGQPIHWSEKEQKFYASKGFDAPKRCKPCREARNKRFAEAKARKSKGNQGSRGRPKQPARSGNRR